MPNYKEIARLKAAGQSNRAIADFLGLSRNTVNAAVARIEDSGLRFEDLQILTDAQINEVFPPTSGRKVEGEYYMPDFEQLKKELAKPGVTLQLLWEEYSDRCRLSGLKPYQLTQFKKHFNDHLKKTLSSTKPESRSKWIGQAYVLIGRILIPERRYMAGCLRQFFRSAV